MFSSKHYVPVLRLKQSEWLALRLVNDRHRKFITPLIEPTPWYFNSGNSRNINKSIEKTIKNLEKSWGKYPAFFDPHIIINQINITNFLIYYFERAKNAKLHLIPVFGFHGGEEYKVIIRSIVKKYGHGVCLRLIGKDVNSTNLKENIENILDYFHLYPSSVDLIFDCKVLLKNFDPKSLSLIIKRMPFVDAWRSFTVLGGSFPKDLSEFSIDMHRIPRVEWVSWLELIGTKLKRMPSFGDYTIQHPNFSEPPKFANYSASVRYTAETQWIILRGEGVRNKGSLGHAQYPAHASLLLELDEFSGANFSAGDLYIDNMAQKFNNEEEIENPGNAGSWLKAGVNHHLTFVADQLANLDGF